MKICPYVLASAISQVKNAYDMEKLSRLVRLCEYMKEDDDEFMFIDKRTGNDYDVEIEATMADEAQLIICRQESCGRYNNCSGVYSD